MSSVKDKQGIRDLSATMIRQNTIMRTTELELVRTKELNRQLMEKLREINVEDFSPAEKKCLKC